MRIRSAILEAFAPALVLVFGLSIALSPVVQAQVQPGRTQAPVALFLGDSIGAGYRITRGDGWVELAHEHFSKQQQPWRIVNASVSGETTAGGLRRLPALLEKHTPRYLIIELGGNDALRGAPPSQIKANIKRMITLARSNQAKIALIGTSLPRNFGRRAIGNYEALFDEIEEELGIPGISLVDSEAGRNTRYLMPDRIHPNARAQPLLAEYLIEFLQPILDKP